MADAITQLMNDIESQDAEGMRRVQQAAAQAALTQSRVMFAIAGNVKHELTCTKHIPGMTEECGYTGQQLMEFELNKLSELLAVPELEHLEEAISSVPRWEPSHRDLPQRVAALGLLLSDEIADPTDWAMPGLGHVLLALSNFESRCPDKAFYRRIRQSVLMAHAMDALYDIGNVEEDALWACINADGQRILVWWNLDGMVTAAAQTHSGNHELWESQDTNWDFQWRISGCLTSEGRAPHPFVFK